MTSRFLALALVASTLAAAAEPPQEKAKVVTVPPAAAPAQPALTDQYKLGPDSKPQDGVPTGKVTKHQIASKVYENTTFTYQVYVPAQYDGTKPAAVFIGQDGNNFVRAINEQTNQPGAWQVPVVFDNLIHKKELPLIIGIFIDPSSQQQRSNQYDTLSDKYARFVIEEVLPEVGKSYKLTSDPEGRVVAGFSSGAICAFTMAWERPDAFRKVASFFGSYTSIAYRPARDGQPMQLGGDLYPTLIRKTPIKPLTIYIQDGSNDLNNEHGSWYLANQQMVSALEWANNNAGRGRGGRGGRAGAPGAAATDAAAASTPPVRYKIGYVFGDGGHTANHGGSIFPDVMRFLLKNYTPKE